MWGAGDTSTHLSVVQQTSFESYALCPFAAASSPRLSPPRCLGVSRAVCTAAGDPRRRQPLSSQPLHQAGSPCIERAALSAGGQAGPGCSPPAVASSEAATRASACPLPPIGTSPFAALPPPPPSLHGMGKDLAKMPPMVAPFPAHPAPIRCNCPMTERPPVRGGTAPPSFRWGSFYFTLKV